RVAGEGHIPQCDSRSIAATLQAVEVKHSTAFGRCSVGSERGVANDCGALIVSKRATTATDRVSQHRHTVERELRLRLIVDRPTEAVVGDWRAGNIAIE